jgi:hypothetical protein
MPKETNSTASRRESSMLCLAPDMVNVCPVRLIQLYVEMFLVRL